MLIENRAYTILQYNIHDVNSQSQQYFRAFDWPGFSSVFVSRIDVHVEFIFNCVGGTYRPRSRLRVNVSLCYFCHKQSYRICVILEILSPFLFLFVSCSQSDPDLVYLVSSFLIVRSYQHICIMPFTA